MLWIAIYMYVVFIVNAWCLVLKYKVFDFVDYLLYCSIILCYFEVQ